MTIQDTDRTFLVPLPEGRMDDIAALLDPYLDDGCVAVGPGWALFSNAAQADSFAERLCALDARVEEAEVEPV